MSEGRARPAAAVFPPREQLLESVRGILASYSGTAVTVRQLYYRLVASAAIPNNLRSYKNLVAALTTWRRSRELPLNAFEDRTRGMKRLDTGWRKDDPRRWLGAWFKEAVRQSMAYQLARWAGQEHRVVVAVEKQALEGPFSKVCTELGVDLVVCRGYPSLSFLNEVGAAMRKGDSAQDGRKNVLLYFGDFDPSGLNIPEVVERDLREFFRVSMEFRRVALTREQIDERDLPPAPVKLSDSRAGGFVLEHGEEVYELDAIEPRELEGIVRAAVEEWFDNDTFTERERQVAQGRELIERLMDEAGIEEFMDRLSEGEA